jgi:hypothetical protein
MYKFRAFCLALIMCLYMPCDVTVFAVFEFEDRWESCFVSLSVYIRKLYTACPHFHEVLFWWQISVLVHIIHCRIHVITLIVLSSYTYTHAHMHACMHTGIQTTDIHTDTNKRTETLTLGLKWPGHEANHWPPSSAKVKNVWSYTSTP